MRALLVTLLVLFPAAPAAATEVQRLGTGLPRYADGAISEDGSAVAYEARRGIVLRRLRADGRFGRPVLVASRARGGRADWSIKVATRGRRAVVAWVRDDGTVPEDPDMRDEGCCGRVHAVVVRANGRPGKPRRLSPPERSADLGPLVVGPRSEVVSWYFEYGDWNVRVHDRRGRWLAAQPVAAGTPGDLRFVGRRLLALAVEEVGSAIRVVTRAVGARGRTHSAHRVATFRGILDGASLRLDRGGSATGVIDVFSYPANKDRLIANGRSRLLGLGRDEDPRSSTAASGASAVLAMRGSSPTVGRIRVRPHRLGAFGRWRRVRLSEGRGELVNIGLRTRDDGRVAVATLYLRRGRRTLAVSGVPGGLRKVRRYRGAEMQGVVFDRLGRLTVLMRAGRRMEVVRP